jgi:hypothetical protein
VGWIILGLVAIVVAGIVSMGVRRRRAFQAHIISQPDQWKVARDAAIIEGEARLRAQTHDDGGGIGG